MPFTMPNFPILSFEQANPLLASIKYGAGIGNDLLDAIQKSLVNQKMQAELPYAGQLAQSTAAYKNAMAKYLQSPTQALRNLSPLGKEYLEPNLLPAVSQYYGGGRIPGMQGGEETGGQASSLEPSEIQKDYQAARQLKTTDPVLRRQASSAQELMDQVNSIDTKPMEEFSGLGGKAKLWEERGKGMLSSLGFNVKPSDEFRKYNTFVSNNKYFIMDMIRKALATSVSPGYVMNTLAPMLNPESPIWSDPEQVRQNIQGLKNVINNYASQSTNAMRLGVAPTLNQAKQRYEDYKNSQLEQGISEVLPADGATRLSRNLQLPSFNSKDEFVKYYNEQPEMVKRAIRLHLGGQ